MAKFGLQSGISLGSFTAVIELKPLLPHLLLAKSIVLADSGKPSGIDPDNFTALIL